MDLPLITRENYFSRIGEGTRPWQEDFLAMYSSIWPGVTMDPALMTVPIDDHVVHRGDGVFEVMRCVRGSIYQMENHLRRLERSAGAVSLAFPEVYDHISDIIKEVVVMAGEKDCLIKIIVSRGPGGFGIDPFECPEAQVYVVVIRFHPLPEESYQRGVSLVTSRIPIKRSFFANIKSCNYLPNVLMKLDAVQSGCPYAVGLDEDGYLAEGPTENVAVLTSDGVLRFPEFERTLSGTTASRVFHLAGKLVKQGLIRDVVFSRIPPDDAYRGKEMFLTGTSLNILPVVTYDGKPVGEGVPGPVYARLSSLLWRDMTGNRDLLTPVPWGLREPAR